MKIIAMFAPVALALSIWSGAALASGPAAGTGPWVACANNDLTCAAQLGSDLNGANSEFDCLAPNGSAGIGMLNINSGKAHCYAV